MSGAEPEVSSTFRSNLSFPGFGLDERTSEDLGQWFTDPALARRMRDWAGRGKFARVLEPSAGSGNLVHVALTTRGADGIEAPSGSHITAYEIDPYYVDRLRERFAGNPNLTVCAGSYLEAPPPAEPYDYCPMNPPFEDGKDGLFIAKAMNECLRITVLARTCVLNGKERHEQIWSRCEDGGDWAVRGLVPLPKRPVFQAGRAIGERIDGGGAKADFCVIKMSRRELGEGPTTLEWWV